MELFKVEVQEILSRTIEIQANGIDEAISIANKMYKAEEVVLDYNDFVDVDFIDVNIQSKED